MEVFEGYTGIGWGDGLLIHDILMLAIIIQLSIFAYAFYTCYPLFEKMLRECISVKERQNLFDTPTQESVFFNLFMGFQTLFLCAVFFFIAFSRLANIQEQDVSQAFILLVILFGLLILFYVLKRFLYFIYSLVFIENSKYNLWKSTYHALFCLWGISLYFPVLWLMLDRQHITGALSLFIFVFILFRITAIYVKIRIFFYKNNGLLFLISYLCAQEFIPLLFLYESLTYLHHVIETSIVWQ